MSNLAIHEPLALPDLRRPERMPSLPAWVASRSAALAENLQVDPATGSFRDMLTLPRGLELTTAQAQAIDSHIDSLRFLLGQTPEASQEAEAETLVLVTKMLLVLPSQRTSETGAEAKGEAYMDALDDVPTWSVRAGLRKWYRGECGEDENGKPYDYRWAPGPADLRRVSLACLTPTRARILQLERLLSAVPFVDCSAELRRGQAAWIGLLSAIKEQRPDVASLTFEQAIEIGEAKASAPTTANRDDAG